MNTKELTYFALILLISAISGCRQGSNNRTTDPERPNIIFIMADDLAAQAITAYGSIYEQFAPTPHLDRLAEEGILLNNVFCTNAICGPSRACILTGKYNHVNGYYKNESGGQFNPDQWTFPEELQKHGYQTGLFGKWHLGSEPRGFDYFKFHQGAGQQGFYWDPVYNENGTSIKEKGYATNLTTDFALDWLADATAKDKPFCLLLQYKAPHRNWDPDSVYADLWEDTELPYPETYSDTYATREKTAGNTEMTLDDLNRKDMKMTPPKGLEGAELGKWYSFGNKREEIVYPDKTLTPEENRKWKYQTYIKDYLACIKSVDDNIGRLLAYLDQHDLSGNTLVIYTSDQGFYLGEHGWFDKRFIYEESLRMPFMVRYPGVIIPGSTNDDIITNIDFAPMILEAVGIEPPEDVQGESFYNNLLGQTPDDWQKSMYYHYYEYPFWHHVQPHYGIRNQRYKLAHFYYDIDVWEFFDLEKDPDEMTNEADNPEYAEVIKRMKEELRQLMIKYQNNKSLEDLRAITDKDFGQIE